MLVAATKLDRLTSPSVKTTIALRPDVVPDEDVVSWAIAISTPPAMNVPPSAPILSKALSAPEGSPSG